MVVDAVLEAVEEAVVVVEEVVVGEVGVLHGVAVFITSIIVISSHSGSSITTTNGSVILRPLQAIILQTMKANTTPSRKKKEIQHCNIRLKKKKAMELNNKTKVQENNPRNEMIIVAMLSTL